MDEGKFLHSIRWRRLDVAGSDSCTVSRHAPHWYLQGVAAFGDSLLEYAVVCDEAWRTLSGRVTGRSGDREAQIEIVADAAGRWTLNGKACPQVDGCIDLDLEFSPATNLLPIRRLKLRVGEEGESRAAWLRLPGFQLEPLRQRYRRTGDETYAYEVTDGSFQTELKVDQFGFVIDYPGLWRREPV